MTTTINTTKINTTTTNHRVLINGVNTHDSDVEIDLSSLPVLLRGSHLVVVSLHLRHYIVYSEGAPLLTGAKENVMWG